MTRAEMILRSVAGTLDRQPDYDEIASEWHALREVAPTPDSPIDDLVQGIGEHVLRWMATAYKQAAWAEADARLVGASGAALGLALYACLEAGRAIQQDETRGIAAACAVDVEVG